MSVTSMSLTCRQNCLFFSVCCALISVTGFCTILLKSNYDSHAGCITVCCGLVGLVQNWFDLLIYELFHCKLILFTSLHADMK